MCCDFECLFWCAGWLAVGCCHPKFWFGLVWFGFSSVFCTASASCSSSGVSFGGVAASRKADEKTREQKRRKECCSFLKGFELIYKSVSLHLLHFV